MLTEALGDQIRIHRRRAGLTLERLASASGISLRFLQDIEAGRKQPSIESLFKLANALNLSPGVLLDEVFSKWQKLKPE